MGQVGTGFSMSLDGFIAGPGDDVSRVFAWMFKGDADYSLSSGGGEIDLKVSSDSVEMFEETIAATGALVTGRHLFDITQGWGGKHPLGVPVVVVTHNVPQEWAYEGSPFTFVTDGVASAIEKAREIAGNKKIAVASTTIAQECLRLGLLDDIHIDLVPVLLGDGVRLFDHLSALGPVELEITNVVQDRGVTHLDYRIVK